MKQGRHANLLAIPLLMLGMLVVAPVRADEPPVVSNVIVQQRPGSRAGSSGTPAPTFRASTCRRVACGSWPTNGSIRR